MFSVYTKRSAWIGVGATLILLGISGIGAGSGAGTETGAGVLPEPLKRCHVDDEDCLVSQANIFFRTFKYGIPERSVPGLEPLQLGTLSIISGDQSSSLKFNLIMRNTTLHNFADTAVMKSLKGFGKDQALKPLKLIWIVSTPALEVHAKYDVNGQFLILPIVSQGDIIINLNHVLTKTRVSVDLEKRTDGQTYLKITDYKMIAKVGSGHFNMTNLFNDNEELRESTLKILNDEWNSLLLDIQPKIMEACDHTFRTILQKFWDTIPFDELFEN